MSVFLAQECIMGYILLIYQFQAVFDYLMKSEEYFYMTTAETSIRYTQQFGHT